MNPHCNAIVLDFSRLRISDRNNYVGVIGIFIEFPGVAVDSSDAVIT